MLLTWQVETQKSVPLLFSAIFVFIRVLSKAQVVRIIFTANDSYSMHSCLMNLKKYSYASDLPVQCDYSLHKKLKQATDAFTKTEEHSRQV